MQPVVHGLEAQYGNEIEFVYLNIDEPATLPAKQALSFRFQPHFVLLDADGQVIEEWLGYVEAGEFEQAFQQLIGG